MANIAVITGASSGLGVKFLEAVVNRYPQMDEYWILARRKERLDKLAGKYKNKKVVAIEVDLSGELLEKHINVLLLCPGNMDTEMNPKGQGRQSQKISKLPFLDMSEITAKALEKTE